MSYSSSSSCQKLIVVMYPSIDMEEALVCSTPGTYRILQKFGGIRTAAAVGTFRCAFLHPSQFEKARQYIWTDFTRSDILFASIKSSRSATLGKGHWGSSRDSARDVYTNIDIDTNPHPQTQRREVHVQRVHYNRTVVHVAQSRPCIIWPERSHVWIRLGGRRYFIAAGIFRCFADAGCFRAIPEQSCPPAKGPY